MRAISLRPSVLAGIAIQPENIHLVLLQQIRNGFLITKVCRYSLPAEVFSEGKIISFQGLENKLAEIVEREGLRGVRAAICLAANQVKMQHITVPAGLSEKDIEAEIRVLNQRALPAKNDALAIDFHTSAADHPEEVRVFFTVARLEYVQRYQACLDAVGMKTAMVDIDVFALLRAARYALRDIWMDQEKICVLYVGNNYAVIVAQHSGHMLFHQQWDGGNNGTHTMTCWQWLEWCCHTWRHLEIESVAIGGSNEHIYQAAGVIAAKWSCKIYEPDPFQRMLGASMVDKSLISNCPSAFLLAGGLAMRKVLPWWK